MRAYHRSTNRFVGARHTCAAMYAVLAALLVLLCAGAASAQTANTIAFDHNQTGFPLTGGHIGVPCEGCHT